MPKKNIIYQQWYYPRVENNIGLKREILNFGNVAPIFFIGVLFIT